MENAFVGLNIVVNYPLLESRKILLLAYSFPQMAAHLEQRCD